MSKAKYAAGVVTVSDTCFRKEKEDLSGPALVEALRNAGFEVFKTAIVPDEIDAICKILQEMIADPSIHFVMTTGGTGFGPRDVTPEATRSFIDRPAPGFAELLRQSGATQTPLTWLSRGESGIAKDKIIINLPGSTKAMSHSIETLRVLLTHALDLLNGEKPH